MKFTIDVDCTPEEARAFLGLPDVKAAQDAVMGDIEERMRASLAAMDPETLLKTWLPTNPADRKPCRRHSGRNLVVSKTRRPASSP